MNISSEDIKKVCGNVYDNSEVLIDIVNRIIGDYTRPLDTLVETIHTEMRTGEMTDERLDSCCMMLSSEIYFLSDKCEQLGIKEDISKEIYKEMYNSKRNEIKGTIADKDAYAELNSQKEQLTNICYAGAYKIMRAKIDNAQELLASIKKVISRRIQEMTLTTMQRG